MPKSDAVEKVENKTREKHEDVYEVVLFNDDHNAAHFVVDCLIKTFKHPPFMAVKVMLEAHNNGRAIAEVEAKSDAVKHKQQLVSAGLTVEVEKI